MGQEYCITRRVPIIVADIDSICQKAEHFVLDIDAIELKLNAYRRANKEKEYSKEECYEIYYLLRDFSGSHIEAMCIIDMMFQMPKSTNEYAKKLLKKLS